ncbi:hypothetical protein PoB_004071700 [Plakobranchus ocellatus]|uniref:Uncharacterized protein n=1 Tax=Plakobranchus ocellatus TaxID=259542 RepID=A0AAV4B3V5_9GAST|nr:hypothetical protein PoB_004071700 [Plakobranchus ocellatus]
MFRTWLTEAHLVGQLATSDRTEARIPLQAKPFFHSSPVPTQQQRSLWTRPGLWSRTHTRTSDRGSHANLRTDVLSIEPSTNSPFPMKIFECFTKSILDRKKVFLL